MNTITHPPVLEAMQRLRELSSDEEVRRLAFMRERVLAELDAERRVGLAEGLQEGWQKGWKKGRQEGIQIGESRGRAATLARLLQLKFGPLAQVTQQRLEQADEANLELWTERVLSAQSLQEVFA